MKRLITAFTLLLLAAGLCVFEFFFNTGEAEYAAGQLRLAQEQTAGGEREKAIETISTLRERWESSAEAMLIFISHEKPDEIGEDIAVAESYLKSGELPEFYAECSRAQSKLEHFGNLESPSFNNIL